MSEIIDPRPLFVIVMGCNGAGKSAWKRANYERLPERFFDQDSIAGGIGDWNDQGARERTRQYVDAEIENILADMPELAEYAVVGRPSERWGQTPVACVVLREGARLDEGQLLSRFNGLLACYKHPRSVLFLPALPRNAMGKVLKYKLRERLSESSM